MRTRNTSPMVQSVNTALPDLGFSFNMVYKGFREFSVLFMDGALGRKEFKKAHLLIRRDSHLYRYFQCGRARGRRRKSTKLYHSET